MEGDQKLRSKTNSASRDAPQDAWLLRDLAIINTRTAELLGELPAGGLPILPKRKPASLPELGPVPDSFDDEESAMPKIPLQVSAIASLALAACTTPGVATSQPTNMQETAPMQRARYTYPETAVLVSGELQPDGDPAIATKMNYKPVAWPLRFKKHSFGPRCYDTLQCEVVYDNFSFGVNEPTKSSASYGPDYLKGWTGSYGAVPNFPIAAQVVWRSKDGTSHEADIDIGQIFSDELVQHFVPREEIAEVPNGEIVVDPSVLLEVNDRTIRVYMSAYVPTRHLQIPGNRRSGFRDDLVLVRTYTY